MEWMNKQVSFFSSHADNVGVAMRLRDIILSESCQSINTIRAIRKLDRSASDFDVNSKKLKAKLPCFTPAGLLATKAKGQLKEIQRTGVMQLDFDYKDIKEYDVDELKQCVFNLPFVGFCGLSCSGNGFYALVLIAEPEHLSEYAEHCFEVLLQYGIKADTSKGKKVENLRYVSYDGSMLIRDNPEVLKIKEFRKKQKPQTVTTPYNRTEIAPNSGGFIKRNLQLIQSAAPGERWATVQKAAYTLGGVRDQTLLSEIRSIIQHASQFAGLEDKYIKCAEDCFKAGSEKPF